MYTLEKNPVPHSGLFTSPSLEKIQEFINGLPKAEQANANLVFMFTINSCHDLVKEAMVDEATV
jgi:hypothetical protein